jgi:hypothetical protein
MTRDIKVMEQIGQAIWVDRASLSGVIFSYLN